MSNNTQLLRILSFLVLLMPMIFGSSTAFSQANKKIAGKVTDSSGVAISDATILLIDQKDTVKTTTNSDGLFNFTKIKSETVTLNITIMGYHGFKQSYTFGKKRNLNLDDIKLKLASNMLKEVVIKAKPNPIRIMQDTIEYNAAAYQVFDGDNVADLIKQFSGIEVDEDYNVKSMGQDVVKLRVNGKDFFTNNVREFIATLPAGIVSKVQIIDDYGEQANFTGLKIGEPQKLINIVTKPGMDRGKFGSMAINAGTNKQIGSKNRMNLWNGEKQTGLGLNYTTQDNGAGSSTNSNISVNHRDKIGKTGNISFYYGLNQGSNAYNNEQAVETISSLGTYFNASQNNGNSKNTGHNFNTDFFSSNKKLFLNGSVSAGFSQNGNNSFTLNNQSGVTKQDFKNLGETDSRSPNISANLNVSKRLKDSRNFLSANFSLSTSNSRSKQLINTNTLYYDQQDGSLLKDSLLNRDIDNRNNSQSFSFSTNYSFAFSKPKDSVSKHISFNYSLSLSNTSSRSATQVLSNLTNEYHFIDSLSSELKSLFINQTLGTSYSYNSKKTRFSVGFNMRPSILRNNYINLNQQINNNNLNYSPTLNYSRTIEKGKTLSFAYNGNNNSPSPNQLQPIRNTQNLQNIVIGNPDLKPSFQHRLNANYNYVEAKSGSTMFIAANFSTTQNEIVNNVIIVPDTLGTFRQETRYENTNGTYNLSANYNISIPLKKNVLTIGNNGTIGISNRALFINNERYFNSGLNFSQSISGNLNIKKMSFTLNTAYKQVNNNNVMGLQNSYVAMNLGSDMLLSQGTMPQIIQSTFNPGQFTTTQFFVTRTFSSNFNGRVRLKSLQLNGSANYSYSSNSNTSTLNGNRDLQTLSLSFNGNTTIKKTYRIGVSVSKRINSGYAIANQNPLLVGANLSKQFLKNKSLSLNASVSDLLNQGNMVFRQVSGNSVIDSKSNVITRVFSFGLSYNISKFGAKGTNFRVDPD